MITQHERENITQGFKNLLSGIDLLINIFLLIRKKEKVIITILTNRFPDINQNFQNQITDLLGHEGKLHLLKEKFTPIPSLDDDISEQLKTFLQSEIVSFNPDQLYLLDPSSYQQLVDFLNKQEDFAINISPEDNYKLDWLSSLPSTYVQYINNLHDILAKLHIFNQLRGIHGNIVMVGANGSGKSSFARQLNGKISRNIVILSAQHLLFYSKSQTMSSSGDELQKVRSFQKNTKLADDHNFTQLINSDMINLVSSLVSEHTDCALNYFDNDTKSKSFLSKTISLWEYIIEHRSLKNDRTGIFVTGPNNVSYQFNQLSDGEKAVFYYIGHILLAPENSYIIVDEPENHLHLAICNKLWDCLEQERSDCKFIYLTHNLDFATSRTDSTILWNKSFIPPSQWNFEILPSTNIIPEIMVMELVGSRKNICFCEGDTKSSLDYKLYSILFPNYTVIPVSGHRNVIDYTEAYNKTSSFVTSAIGIIDGDCHLPTQIDKWKQKKIFVLPINEIENLLCDPLILQKAISRFCSSSDSLDSFYDRFWKIFESDKEQQTVWYVNNQINAIFKDNYLHEKNNIQNLKAELKTITSPQTVERLYKERLDIITSLIQNKDFEKALAMSSLKKRLTREIANVTIVDQYETRVLDLIKKDNDLKKTIVEKYFTGIEDLDANLARKK